MTLHGMANFLSRPPNLQDDLFHQSLHRNSGHTPHSIFFIGLSTKLQKDIPFYLFLMDRVPTKAPNSS